MVAHHGGRVTESPKTMKNSALPDSLPPRGLNRAKAAEYIGVSPGLFDEMVADGRMPPPKKINARRVWDRKGLDESFDALPDDESSRANPWDALHKGDQHEDQNALSARGR